MGCEPNLTKWCEYRELEGCAAYYLPFDICRIIACEIPVERRDAIIAIACARDMI